MLGVNNSAQRNQYPAFENPCIVATVVIVNVNKLTLVKMGQGKGETKWPLKVLGFKFDILNCIFSLIQKMEYFTSIKNMY